MKTCVEIDHFWESILPFGSNKNQWVFRWQSMNCRVFGDLWVKMENLKRYRTFSYTSKWPPRVSVVPNVSACYCCWNVWFDFKKIIIMIMITTESQLHISQVKLKLKLMECLSCLWKLPCMGTFPIVSGTKDTIVYFISRNLQMSYLVPSRRTWYHGRYRWFIKNVRKTIFFLLQIGDFFLCIEKSFFHFFMVNRETVRHDDEFVCFPDINLVFDCFELIRWAFREWYKRVQCDETVSNSFNLYFCLCTLH